MLPCIAGEKAPLLRRVAAPRAMAPLALRLLYHEDLRRSPRGRRLHRRVIAANRAALVPDGFPFDPA